MPLQFEANHGQVDAPVKFMARGKGYTLFLTPTESVMVLQQRETTATKGSLPMTDPTALREPASIKQAVVRMKLEGSNQTPAIDGMEKLPGIVNYFIGNDPTKWRTEIPTYAKVQYQEAYPGIDLAYYGNQGKLEYDFIVAPEADPNQIKLAFQGASDIRVVDSGDLLITTELGDVRMQQPIVYQLEPDGHKTLVAGRYFLNTQSVSPHASHIMSYSVGFQLAAYDHSKQVVIDPVLSWATYLGSSNNDQGMGIAVDAFGQAYVSGYTESPDFPTTPSAFQTQSFPSNVHSAFVTKLNAAGTSLLYSTYLGGGVRGEDIRIAVDVAGQAYVTGHTGSPNFPTTPGAFQTTLKDADAFITKLNADGTSLLYSTFLGGSDYFDLIRSIALDAAGQAYVTGSTESTDFPTTPGTFQPTPAGGGDVFVTKLSTTGTSLVYSTYLGGNALEWGRGITVDGAGQAYVTGFTDSTNFPTTPGAFQTVIAVRDVFVTKLSPDGTSLLYSTFLGGVGYEGGTGIAVDGAGQAYVTGQTTSTNFPTTPGAFQTTMGGPPIDAFVTKLTATGTNLVYSTYLGGGDYEEGAGIAVDGAGQAYVTGQTTSTNFPTTPGAFQTTFGGSGDTFVTKLGAAGTSLLYSTYLSGGVGFGIAVDAADQAYVTGYTFDGFPTTPGTFQATFGGFIDVFVAKLNFPTNTSPICSAAKANPDSLWQPDGRMVPIAVTGVTDPEGDSVTLTVTTVTQDEPIFTKGAKKLSPDAVIQAGAASVRAERLDTGNGRVYQISFRADDGKGGSCTGAVKIGVPLNLKKGLIPIDDGQLYDSTIP